jgi:hypothetical protein
VNKIENLKMMNKIARSLNNSDYVHYWLAHGIPDGTTKDDFSYLVADYEEFERVFIKTLQYALKDGLFNITDEELDFARQYQPNIKNVK